MKAYLGQRGRVAAFPSIIFVYNADINQNLLFIGSEEKFGFCISVFSLSRKRFL